MPEHDDPVLSSTQDADTQSGGGTNLADLILQKIALHEAATGHEPRIQGGGAPEEAIELPAKVVEVYSKYVISSNIPGQLTDRVTWLELGCCSLVTNQASYRNLSRSCQRCLNGKSYFQ